MNTAPSPLRLVPLTGIPGVHPGDDLPALILEAAARASLALRDGVLVVCQKVVSKAEGRVVALAKVEPGEEARRIAAEDDKDPRHVEVVLRETRRIVRHAHGVMICETTTASCVQMRASTSPTPPDRRPPCSCPSTPTLPRGVCARRCC